MAHTEVLLLQPVENLGGEGDQVKVRAGYARNFLLPRKVAAPLTAANRRQIEALKKRRSEREKKDLDHAQAIAGKIQGLHVAIAVKTGEGGKMFGAVTAADLHERLAENGIEVDRKRIQLYNPIKSLGRHSTRIRLHPDVAIDFEFDVVSENVVESTESGDSAAE